jgi:tight adherence protein C
MGLYIGIGIGLIIILAIVLIVAGMRDSDNADPLQSRLAEFVARGDAISLEEIELSQPISERIIFPIARGFGEFAIRFTPQKAIQDTERKLELAGNPSGLDPTLYWALRFLGLSLGLLIFFLSIIAPEGSFIKGKGLLYGIPAAVVGFYLPELWLRGRINRRQKEILNSMPDALDLLTICVEAGLGFDAAMAKVHDKWDNELSHEFGRVIREIQLGKLRREALRDMADRIGVPEMTSFVAAVIQSEQLGVSMAKVLRIQSDQMRIRRRQRAEEAAQKAPLKMLIPMAFLIFPSICIVLMSPAIIMLFKSALGGILGM